jgi:cell division protein FtsI (penicillin-binding protein 3)
MLPARTQPADDGRFTAVASLVMIATVLAGIVLVARVAQLQLAPGESLRAEMTPRESRRPQPALRGDLLDRRGRLLSATRFASRVIVDPHVLSEKNLDRAIVELAEVLGLSPDALGTRVRGAQRENERRAQRPIADVGAPVAASFASPGGESGAIGDAKGPIRYLPVGGLIDDGRAQAVRQIIRRHSLKGVMLERKPVREYATGEEAAALVGKVGVRQEGEVSLEDVGVLGAERMLEGLLAGSAGAVSYMRDARGRPLWMDPGSVRPARAGQDARLSIDLELQRMCHAELMQGVLDQDAQGGRLVLADPNTGEVLAMVDIVREVAGAVPYPWVDIPPPRKPGTPARAEPDVLAGKPRRYRIIPEDANRKVHPSLARNRCLEDMYEPGSTFKPFVWSTINELGLIRLDEVIDTEGGRWTLPIGRYLEDVVKRDRQSWHDVLVNSSNIGMVKGAARMTPRQLHDACTRFGFGKPTGIGFPDRPVPGESAGAVTPLSRWTRFTHTSVPYGHEIGVTPVQMVRAFSAFARRGEMAGTLPRLRLDEVSGGEPHGVIYRVLPPSVALGVREPLAKVADKMQETMKNGLKMPVPEGGWRYRIFGKSGTADVPLGPAPKGKKRPKGSSGYYDDHFNSSFIAAGPLEDPRLVICVVIDDPRRPGDRRLRYGAAAAGPVARRVTERALTYLGVPPSPTPPAPGAN